MSNPFIIAAKSDLPLKPAPIEPSWITEGRPEARNAVLSRSSDGAACTIVWECTAGKFDWHYDIDETVHIVEGSIVVSADGMAPTRFGPGDVILFAKGAHAHWHVETYVRKVAFCHRVQPRAIGFAMRAAAKLKRMLAPGRAPAPAGLLGVQT